MRRLSLKTRLVLLHTGLMTLVVCLMLGVLLSASSQEILANVENALETRVTQAVEDVEYRQGRLEFDSEFLELENGVYLSAYQPGSSSLLYGRLPYGFVYDLPFSVGELRTAAAGDTEYRVLDMEIPVEGYGNLILRGIVSLSDAERGFRFTLRLVLILLPVLVGLTALCGYLISRRALRPVAQITGRCAKSSRSGICPSGCGWKRALTRSTPWARPLTACWTSWRTASAEKSSSPAMWPMSCALPLPWR